MGLADSTETLLPRWGALGPFSQPGGVASGEPEALLSWPELELLREDGVWGEGPLPWFPEKMRLSLLLRVSRGMSLEKRRLPLRGEPKGGVTHGLEQRWGPSKHLDLVEVTSMYFISYWGWGEKESIGESQESERIDGWSAVWQRWWKLGVHKLPPL